MRSSKSLFNTPFSEKNLDGKTLFEYFRQLSVLRSLTTRRKRESERERIINEHRTCPNVCEHLFLNNHNFILNLSLSLSFSSALSGFVMSFIKHKSRFQYLILIATFFCVSFCFFPLFYIRLLWLSFVCVGNQF